MKSSNENLPAFETFKLGYSRRIEWALLAVIALAGLAGYASQFWYLPLAQQHVEVKIPVITVEHVPATRQGSRLPPPPKPAVVLPSQDQPAPQTVLPEPAQLQAGEVSDSVAGGVEAGEIGALEEVGGGLLSPARPLASVFPQFPEAERKKGVRGEVKLSVEISERGRVLSVTILENTTGSELCAEAAKKAAQATRFLPARGRNGPLKSWFTLSYNFDYRQ
ncbi:MAG: TonB family protein [candidate division KSB1 bacterium]|nr:TonB family protein [candidate division KSB1 bacterium]MDZ7276500.1 TonB family protein [candidate division KSB1 bacterium]MDZ7286719.1 TonB family protein [candidate division KSB1 bacterium]MDZ7300270.1 TonB family protein [candidate division KSB1 bacterium]MDZ7309406.1 TonB family protein [candidate division KSB1 bacterium]